MSSGQTAGLSDLITGQTYTYAAYSDGSCTTANKLDDVTFTTYAFTFVSKTRNSATLRLDPVPSGAKWWYKGTSTPRAVACTETSAAEITVSGLTKNTSYSIQAYLAEGCASSDSIGVVHLKTLPPHALFADSVGQTTATLRLTNANVAWRYQRTTPADLDLPQRRAGNDHGCPRQPVAQHVLHLPVVPDLMQRGHQDRQHQLRHQACRAGQAHRHGGRRHLGHAVLDAGQQRR